MELSNGCSLQADPDRVWEVLSDVARLASLIPAAQLHAVDGDTYRGMLRLRVGPVQAQYKGTLSWVEQDRAAGRLMLRASGVDTRGQGNATATISAVVAPGTDGTELTVETDLAVTGRVAQFGRGVLADMADRLMARFAEALDAELMAVGFGGEPTFPPPPPLVGVAPSGPLPIAGAPPEPATAPVQEASVAVRELAGAGETKTASGGEPAVSAQGEVPTPRPGPALLADTAGDGAVPTPVEAGPGPVVATAPRPPPAAVDQHGAGTPGFRGQATALAGLAVVAVAVVVRRRRRR